MAKDMAAMINHRVQQVHSQLNGKGEAQIRAGEEKEGIELVVCIPIDSSDPVFPRAIQSMGGGSLNIDVALDRAIIQNAKLKMERQTDKIIEEDEVKDISMQDLASYNDNIGDDDYVAVFPSQTRNLEIQTFQDLPGDNDNIGVDDYTAVFPSQTRNFEIRTLPQSLSQSEPQEISLEITICGESSQAKPPICNAVDIKNGSLCKEYVCSCLSPFLSSSSLFSPSSSTISDLFLLIEGEERPGFDPEQRSKPRSRLLTELYGTEHEDVPSNYRPLKLRSSKQRH